MAVWCAHTQLVSGPASAGPVGTRSRSARVTSPAWGICDPAGTRCRGSRSFCANAA